jgi:oligoribonuclease NrnB/cAMP/cGMP phosphodiesterase (DHH superfamily)
MDHDYPTPKVDANDTIIMVDFCLHPFSKMITIKKKAKLFIWIDHHKSAIEENNAVDCTLLGLRREGTAACELTWEYLMHSPVPKPVKLLGAYDVHNLSDQVLHFQ